MHMLWEYMHMLEGQIVLPDVLMQIRAIILLGYGIWKSIPDHPTLARSLITENVPLADLKIISNWSCPDSAFADLVVETSETWCMWRIEYEIFTELFQISKKLK